MDIFTRETQVVLGDNLTDEEGARCVEKILKNLGPCQIFQTDNGGEFACQCEKVIKRFALRHRKIHARRKNENAYIESFHRSLRKECLGWLKYRRQDKDQPQLLITTWYIIILKDYILIWVLKPQLKWQSCICPERYRFVDLSLTLK